jgi:hypothetical protein
MGRQRRYPAEFRKRAVQAATSRFTILSIRATGSLDRFRRTNLLVTSNLAEALWLCRWVPKVLDWLDRTLSDLAYPGFVTGSVRGVVFNLVPLRHQGSQLIPET